MAICLMIFHGALTCLVFLGKKDDDGGVDLIEIPKRTTPAKGIIHISS